MSRFQTGQNWAALIGRILFASIFLSSAISKIFRFKLTVFYMVGAGVASFTEFLLVLAIILELVGGLLVLLGWYTRLGGILLALFIVGVTFSIHHFWTYTSAQEQNQLVNFLKNIALFGGCLYLIAFGGGQYSLDRFRRKHTWF
jgi:putative oxidoreductase